MFAFDYLVLFVNLMFLCIPLSQSIVLDIPCKTDNECDGTGAICRGGKCQCDTPYYTPCGTTNCEPQEKFAYEGDICRIDRNCIDNAMCNTSEIENRCRCKPDYVGMYGLCYKSLNIFCTDPSECWSNECRNNICQCPMGSVPRNDNRRCRQQLPKIYPNWTAANDAGDFCYESARVSCLVPSAICASDSQSTGKFCRCPSTHTADYDKQECRLNVYDGLSPSKTQLSPASCGRCQVENAVCVNVSSQRTCWCLAGFIKNGSQCIKSKKVLIFPNNYDITVRDYTSDCSASKTTGLCTCSSGEQFQYHKRSCQPIQPKREDEEFEYGVCTRINSRDKPVQEEGLCPSPLQCEARRDKYVCTCGVDRYLDEKSQSCHYFLERNLTDPIGKDCPLNSILIGNICRCNPSNIFRVSKDNRYCELELNGTSDLNDARLCSRSNTTDDSFCKKYGKYAQFCRMGECRCEKANAFDANNYCITLIGSEKGENGVCPLHAQDSSGICTCNDGYRVQNDSNRACVPKVNAINEVMPDEQIARWDFKIEDCQALFPRQSIEFVNNSCRCNDKAFSNGTTCIAYLSVTLSSTDEMPCPTDAKRETDHCECRPGYKQLDSKTCERWTQKVYPHNQTSNENKTGITDEDCKALFGPAAAISLNSKFCHCRETNISYFNADQCYFLVDTVMDEIDLNLSCPLHSQKNGSLCQCLLGYQSKSNKAGCEAKPISRSKLQSIDIQTFTKPCDSAYTNQDCQVFFGSSAVCRDNQCFCDHRRSYVHNNRCVLFSELIFPGVHERHEYTCDSRDDCGNNAEKNGIECDFLDDNNYRVCRCQKGYFFNPIDNTCVPSECYPSCSSTEMCENYQCACKIGYYRNASGQCVKFESNLKVYDGCNGSYWSGPPAGELECSPECQRVRCVFGYHDQESKCVKKTLDSRCVHDEHICSLLNPGSTCVRDENRCVCGPDYYSTGDSKTCVRVVGSPCVHSSECGDSGECSNRMCVCKSNQIAIDAKDYYERNIQICVNGVDQLRIHSIFLVFIVVIIRTFFA